MVTANTRVAEIKDLLLLETGASAAQQLLVCGGKEMPDHCCIRDLGIHTSVVVGLIIRPTLLRRGGMEQTVTEETSAFHQAIANLDADAMAIRQANTLRHSMAEDEQRDMETAELAALQRSVHDGGQQAEAAVQYTVMDVEGEGEEEDDGEATAHEEAPIEVTDSTSA